VLLFIAAALVLSEEAKHTLALTTPPQRDGKTESLMLVSTVGLTAMVTAARGGDADDRLGSLSLSSRKMGFAYDRGLDVRVVNTFELGASEHDRKIGFHGGGSVEASGGYRFHVAETHGPFIRGGIEALIGGDSLVYQSLVELPQAQLGYQYIAGPSLFEVAGRSGFSIFGRSDTGDQASRHLDQVLDVGAMGTARTGPVVVTAEWSHFLARGEGAPIDWVTIAVCGIARTVALCTDVRAVSGDVYLPSQALAASRVTQVGITIGSSRY
jgi:hypothetical protein